MTSIVGTPQITDYGFSASRDAVNLSSGIQADDVIFFVLPTANTHSLGTLPAGVSQAGTTQDAASSDSSASILYRIATGSEGATFNLGAIYAAAESGGVLSFVLRGLDTADLIEAVAQTAQSTTGSSETVSGPSVTPTNNNCTILQILACDPGASEIAGAPDASPSSTEVFDGKVDTGNWGYVYAQFYDQATAAALALDATISFGPLNFSTFQFALNTASGPAGPSLDTIPSTAYPGQSRTVSGSGFGAAQGTGGLTIGGVSQTITSWSDTSITLTTVLGANSYGTGKVVELTTDAGGTDTGAIELVADTAGGFGVVTMSSPNTTDESSVAFGATPAVVTGDQFEWEDFNTLGNLAIDAEGFVSSVDTEGTFRGRFWDASDGTWGSVNAFTASATDETAPTISSVDVPTAGSYKAGDDLDFTVNWDEAADVTGTPQLAINIGGTTRQANYVSGDSTTALVLTYTVQAGDNDANGISVTSLGLNGGTIQDAATNNADLTLNSVGDTSAVLVDTIKPVITVTGQNPYTLVVGQAYTDPGATASDDQDGSLGSVTGTGSVDSNTIGQYTITYPGAGVVDTAGNVADDATRTVNVVAEDAYPYSKGIKYAATKTWEWGKRHPKTGMRVRIYK